MECHHCGKKGHCKWDFYAWKKQKNKDVEADAKDTGKAKKSSVVIKKANIASNCDSESGSDVLNASSLDAHSLVLECDEHMHT